MVGDCRTIDDLKLAMILTVCDEDERHFNRFIAEAERLGFPLYVNFDHCSKATQERFRKCKVFAKSYETYGNKPDDLFDESHRQRALNLVLEDGTFDWVLQMDVDETLEKDAPAKIAEIMRMNVDIVDIRELNLWGDDKHYRIDGCFGSSHREKFFNLRTAEKLYYYHPTSHAPKHVPHGGRRVIAVKGYSLHILHWGIMNQEDAEFHCKRWDRIYGAKVGNNPYGFYTFLRDTENYPPVVKEVPKEYL